MTSTKYLIIGASAAGISAARRIRQLDQTGSITILSQEPDIPYNRCLLVDVILGEKTLSSIKLISEREGETLRADIHVNCTVTGIDKELRIVTAQDGRQWSYEKLLLATGARAFVPPAWSSAQKDLYLFYTYEDTQRIISDIIENKSESVVIVGAGLTGIELADALCARSISSVLVERSRYVLPLFLGELGTLFLREKIPAHVLTVLTSMNVTQLQKTENSYVVRIESVKVSHTQCASAVAVSVGSRPNNELAVQAGLCAENEALIPTSSMQTSDPFIWAAGDVIQAPCRFTGEVTQSSTWPDAVQQGVIAGTAMVEGAAIRHYTGLLSYSVSRFFGCDFISMGCMDEKRAAYREESVEEGTYYHLSFDTTSQLIGFVILGSPEKLPLLRQKLLNNAFT